MRNILLIIFLILISSDITSKSFYTIIDDDAISLENIAIIKDVCDKNQIKITFAPIVQNLLFNPQLADKLLSYQEQGFQICNHSLTHNPKIWKDFDLEAIKNEIVVSNRVLDSLGFVDYDYLVYPYGKFSENEFSQIENEVKSNFKLAFNSRGGKCELSNFNNYYINRLPIRKHEHISVLKKKIDNALVQDSWIVFLTHSAISRDFSSNYLTEVIEYCKEKELPCLTVKEAYNQILQYQGGGNADIYEWSLYDEIYQLIETHIYYILSIILVFTLVVLLFI